jgi:glycosyltransferase involved in cell wall biosynthesis
VIVFNDSGGTDEIMEHRYNGLILEPDPRILAEGMENLWSNKNMAKTMGKDAFGTIRKHRISWDNVIERLTS